MMILNDDHARQLVRAHFTKHAEEAACVFTINSNNTVTTRMAARATVEDVVVKALAQNAKHVIVGMNSKHWPRLNGTTAQAVHDALKRNGVYLISAHVFDPNGELRGMEFCD